MCNLVGEVGLPRRKKCALIDLGVKKSITIPAQACKGVATDPWKAGRKKKTTPASSASGGRKETTFVIDLPFQKKGEGANSCSASSYLDRMKGEKKKEKKQ